MFECDDEPLEIEEYEYVKLHKVDGQDGLLQDEETHAKFSYSVEKGIVSV